MNFPWKKQKTELDIVIDDVLARMRVVGPDDEEYEKLVSYLSTLVSQRDENRKGRRVSPDTLAIVLGNIGVVVAIILFEREEVITTKAKDFVLKMRS